MSRKRALVALLFTVRVALIALGIGIELLMPRAAAAQQDIVDDYSVDVSDYCDEGYDCELETYAAIYDTSSTLQLDVESDTSVNLDALDDGYDSYDCAEVSSDGSDIADGCTIDNDGEGDADLPASFSLNSQTSTYYEIDTYSYLADIWDDSDACDDGDPDFCFEIADSGAGVTIGPVQINSVSPSSVTVGTCTGNSECSLTINGVDLANPFGFGGLQPTVGASLNGSTTGLTFTNPNFNDQGTQGTVNYQVASNAETGTWSLGVSYSIGDPVVLNKGSFGNFIVSSNTATVTAIYPGTWTAGQSYTGVQITGTNFGSTPSVTLSDPTITVGSPYNTSTSNGNSTTYINLYVPPTTPSEPVIVTVAPGSGGNPGSNTATVAGPVGGQNSCPTASDADSGFTGIVPTGTAVGSGTATVAFSGGSFNGNSVTAPYGQYSTPESVASHLAALITTKYYKSGLSAQAFGAYIVYKSTAPLGAASFQASGAPFAVNTSSTACPPVNTQFVLTVLNDSVTWISVGMSNGREVEYSLEYWPKPGSSLGAPTTFPNAIITEHLTNSMAYGTSTSGTISGQFLDVLGNTSGSNGGTYVTDRYFTVNSSGQNLGHIMTYDAAGKHATDHIVIYLPKGPSILNRWTNTDGSPKNISIP